MLNSEPETRLSIKFFFFELLRKIALFLRVLICCSLYYYYEYMLTTAIIYTCLDLLPPICYISIIFYNSKKLSKSLIFKVLIKVSEIKCILDPSRILVRYIVSFVEKEKMIIECDSLFTIWYSILGIIFSFIFLSSDLCCPNDTYDKFHRTGRFYAFFCFSLVVNILTFMYSIIKNIVFL